MTFKFPFEEDNEEYNLSTPYNEGLDDALLENPIPNLENISKEASEQYKKGYENGRIEKLEKWLIDDNR